MNAECPKKRQEENCKKNWNILTKLASLGRDISFKFHGGSSKLVNAITRLKRSDLAYSVSSTAKAEVMGRSNWMKLDSTRDSNMTNIWMDIINKSIIVHRNQKIKIHYSFAHWTVKRAFELLGRKLSEIVKAWSFSASNKSDALKNMKEIFDQKKQQNRIFIYRKQTIKENRRYYTRKVLLKRTKRLLQRLWKKRK